MMIIKNRLMFLPGHRVSLTFTILTWCTSWVFSSFGE
jgi:hypothetical protein